MKRRLGSIILVASLVLAGEASAEGPAPFPDFTFKRMKVPGQGASNRITVQIDPSEQPVNPLPIELQPEPPDPVPQGLYDWYWTEVSPSLAASNSGRLEEAVNGLSLGPDGVSVASPRLQLFQEIADEHGVDILKATIGTNVSPALVLALIGIESSGRVEAVSSAGARGLMQLIPATAERFGVKDISLPAENIRGGVAYLNWLMKEFDGDPILLLAAYNAGENSVYRHEGVPPYAETRAYVPKVLAAWSVAKGLCLTTPLLISDGCVFASRGVAKNG